MQSVTFRCACCRRIRPRNPRVKNQRYCGDKRCQQARKTKWEREKLQADPYYRINKRECQDRWVTFVEYWEENTKTGKDESPVFPFYKFLFLLRVKRNGLPVLCV